LPIPGGQLRVLKGRGTTKAAGAIAPAARQKAMLMGASLQLFASKQTYRDGE